MTSLIAPLHFVSFQVPFLSIGEDLGYREVRFRGNSDFSGEFIVEDSRNDEGAVVRRLLFLSTKDSVQTEVRLLPSGMLHFCVAGNGTLTSCTCFGFGEWSICDSTYRKVPVVGIYLPRYIIVI